MQVAGGTIGVLTASQFAHDVIVNGIPIEYWVVSKATTAVLPTAVGQATAF